MPTSDQWDEMTRQAVQEVNTRLGLGVMPPATGLPISTNPGGIVAPPSSYSSPTGGAMGGLPQGYKAGGEVTPRADRHGYGMVPGQGEGDKIPIMAEPGEIVIPKDVVNYKGKQFFLNLIEKTQQTMGLSQKPQKPQPGPGPVRGYALGGEIEREPPLTAPGTMNTSDLGTVEMGMPYEQFNKEMLHADDAPRLQKMGMPYEQFNKEMLHADDPPRQPKPQPLQPQPPTFQEGLVRGMRQDIYGDGTSKADGGVDTTGKPVGIPAGWVKVGEGDWGQAWASPGTAAVGDEPLGRAAREAMGNRKGMTREPIIPAPARLPVSSAQAPGQYEPPPLTHERMFSGYTPQTMNEAPDEELRRIAAEGYPGSSGAVTPSSRRRVGDKIFPSMEPATGRLPVEYDMPGAGTLGPFKTRDAGLIDQYKGLYKAATSELSSREVERELDGLINQLEGLGQKRAEDFDKTYETITGDKRTDAFIHAALAPLREELARGGSVSAEEKQRAVLAGMALASRDGGAGGKSEQGVTADDRPISFIKGKHYVANRDTGEPEEYNGPVFSKGSNAYNDFIKPRYLEMEREHPDWTPQQRMKVVRDEFTRMNDQSKIKVGVSIADERGKWGLTNTKERGKQKLGYYIDPKTYAIVPRDPYEARAENLTPANALTVRQIQSVSRLKDIKMSIGYTYKMLDNPEVKAIFSDPKVSMKIQEIMSSSDKPVGPFRTWFRQRLGRTLTPAQQEYIIKVASMKESANAISPAGAQTTDKMRAYIDAMQPGNTTPSAEIAKKQLELLMIEVDIFGSGYLNVPIRGEGNNPPYYPGREPEKSKGLQPGGRKVVSKEGPYTVNGKRTYKITYSDGTHDYQTK